MKNLLRNWKTSLVGVLGIISFIVNIILLINKTITSSDFAVIMSSTGGFLVILLGLFSKDGDKTGI